MIARVALLLLALAPAARAAEATSWGTISSTALTSHAWTLPLRGVGNACYARPPLHVCVWREPDPGLFQFGGFTTYTDIMVTAYYLIRLEPDCRDAQLHAYAGGDALACVRQLAFQAMPRAARHDPHGIRVFKWRDVLDVELHGDRVAVIAHDPRVVFESAPARKP